MSAKKQSNRQARTSRERVRAYRARQAVHEHKKRRRIRDNVIAVVGLLVIVTLAVLAQLVYFGSGPGATTPTASPSPSPSASASASSEGQNTGDVPDASLAENRTWTGTLTINGIPLGVRLDGAKAPQAVASAIHLAQSGFYAGTVCHRLTTAEEFKVLQCGDPHGDDPDLAGQGGPGYAYGPIENAPADNVYPAGTIAMARQGGNAYSMGSQFFIVYGDTTIPPDAAGGYTVFGHVTSGLDALIAQVADAGVQGGGTDGVPVVTPTITGFEVH